MVNSRELVIVNSRGLDDERASVAWSIANTAAASDTKVTMFLVASGVDCVRRGAASLCRLNPLDPPMGDMIRTFLGNGGRILVCPPCARVRGYEPEAFMEGTTVAGSPAILEVIGRGAGALTF